MKFKVGDIVRVTMDCQTVSGLVFVEKGTEAVVTGEYWMYESYSLSCMRAGLAVSGQCLELVPDSKEKGKVVFVDFITKRRR